MELEISPEPTAEERAAIVAALAEAAEEPASAWTAEPAEPYLFASFGRLQDDVRGLHPLQRGPCGR
jgi:hypothetical protein